MFKLVKISGAKNNVPEFIRMPISANTKHTAGCLYYIENGVLALPTTYTGLMPFIPVESVGENDGRTDILGYLVTPDMVFEAPIDGDLSLVHVGAERDFLKNDDDEVYGVSADGGTSFLLLNIDDLYKKRTVLTSIVCITP